MASIIGVETLQHTNGTTAATIQSDGTFYPAGHIIQVVSTTKTDAFSTTALPASREDVTGFTANITPKSTSSKILVRASLNYGGSNNVYGGFWFLRDGTDIIVSTAVSGSNNINPALAVHGDNSNFQFGMQSAQFEYLDSPSSTSQLTYKMQMSTHDANNTFYLNRSHIAGNDTYVHGGTSTLTLMEIAG